MNGSSTPSRDQDTYYERVTSSTAAGRLIRDAAARYLPDYLRSIAPNRPLVDNPSSHILVQALTETAARHEDPDIVTRAIAEFRRSPIMQLADGANLLLDTETLVNHLQYQLACREAGIDYMWSQQCTTVRAITATNPLRGPAILETNQDYFAVLPGSRKKLLRTNVACIGPIQFKPTSLGIKAHDPTVQPPRLLKPVLGAHYDSAPRAILAVNRIIWSRLQLSKKKKLVLFDEDLSAEVIQRHLEQRAEPISDLVCDDDTRNAFLHVKRDIVNSSGNFVLRATTDLFWIRHEHRLRPCTIEYQSRGPALLRARHGGPTIELTRDSVIEHLSCRNLYPDLILAYLALVVLPGVTAAGGASQHEYLPHIERLVTRAHGCGVLFPDAVISRIAAGTHSALIGPALLALDDCQRNTLLSLDDDTSLDTFEYDVMHRKIAETAGDLDYLRYLDHLRATRIQTQHIP
ncbi:MAG: hypothetical protein ACRDTE_14435 [Pseudonocardiaceae bacterium]